MLADPNKWCKEHLKPIWKRVVQQAAGFFLILLVGLGSAMAISPTVRAAVINFVKEVFQNQVIYRYTGISNDEKKPELPDFEITNLPDSYIIKIITFLYSNSIAGPHLAGGAASEPVTVNGCSGMYYAVAGSLDEYSGYAKRMTEDEAGNEIVAVSYQPRNKATLTWTNAEGVTFTIFGAFEKDVLLKMAESITPRAFLTEGDGT